MDQAYPQPPPPDPSEPSSGPTEGSTFPRWPAWYGPVGFLAATFASVVVAGVVIGGAAVVLGTDLEDPDVAVNVVGVLAQDLILVATAIGFAWITTRPRLWHFGLRRARFWPALGWAALGMFAFYVFAGIYSALVGIDEEQTTLQDLGASESAFGLVSAAVLVVVLAPIVEELFFRGFFYRSLRTSLPSWAAAPIVGIVFGIVHAFTGVEAVPILIFLGTVLCLVYERTGTLYAPIAMHAFNNMLGFSLNPDGSAALGLPLGVAMILTSIVAPRFLGRSAPAPV